MEKIINFILNMNTNKHISGADWLPLAGTVFPYPWLVVRP